MLVFYYYRYVMLDLVDGIYGGLINDGKNGIGMVGMVMRGVCICISMLRLINGFMFGI